MKKDFKYILKRIIIGVALFLIFGLIKSCEVHALEIRQKIGNSYINGNNYFPVNTDGLTKEMNISYLYDLTDSSDYDYAIKYNLISAPTGTGSNVYKKTYYFVLSYCSNVGASVVDIYNSNYNYIDANYGTGTVCHANGYVGQLFNAYLRMAPTSANIGNSGTQIIYFNNTLQLQSRFSYNGYIGFNALNILTYEEYQKAIDNRSLLYQQQVLNDSINAMKNQAHQDSINEQNAINGVNSSLNNDSVDTADSKASEWASKSLSDNAVANMVTMPITLLQAYLNGLNGSCSSFSLGTLYGHELTLPCINLSSYFGSTLWGVIDILFSGFMIYALGRKFVKIFNDFTNLRDNQVDELYGGGN